MAARAFCIQKLEKTAKSLKAAKNKNKLQVQNMIAYCISLVRRCGYYAACFVWLLFEGGYYSRAAFLSLEGLETSMTAG